MTLRVIQTPESRRHPEPWYILTNDLTSSRTKIARIYYHRFEIEEAFKDAKHLFELKRVQFDKPNSLKILLWFVSIGIALLYMTTKATMHQEHYQNNKKRRSWVRIAYEQFQRELTGYRGANPSRGGKGMRDTSARGSVPLVDNIIQTTPKIDATQAGA